MKSTFLFYSVEAYLFYVSRSVSVRFSYFTVPFILVFDEYTVITEHGYGLSSSFAIFRQHESQSPVIPTFSRSMTNHSSANKRSQAKTHNVLLT